MPFFIKLFNKYQNDSRKCEVRLNGERAERNDGDTGPEGAPKKWMGAHEWDAVGAGPSAEVNADVLQGDVLSRALSHPRLFVSSEKCQKKYPKK